VGLSSVLSLFSSAFSSLPVFAGAGAAFLAAAAAGLAAGFSSLSASSSASSSALYGDRGGVLNEI